MYKYGGKSREHSVQFHLTYKMLISHVCIHAVDSFRILEIKRVPSIFEISRCHRWHISEIRARQQYII